MRVDRYEAPSFARLGDGANRQAGTPWLPLWSPVAVRRAIHASLVMPTLFAITYKGSGNLQTALFAGFGSLARW